MDPFDLGREDWAKGVPFCDNPFEGADQEDADQWEEGWATAESENSRVGVGA